jgi:hypothetical protein
MGTLLVTNTLLQKRAKLAAKIAEKRKRGLAQRCRFLGKTESLAG